MRRYAHHDVASDRARLLLRADPAARLLSVERAPAGGGGGGVAEPRPLDAGRPLPHRVGGHRRRVLLDVAVQAARLHPARHRRAGRPDRAPLRPCARPARQPGGPPDPPGQLGRRAPQRRRGRAPCRSTSPGGTACSPCSAPRATSSGASSRTSGSWSRSWPASRSPRSPSGCGATCGSRSASSSSPAVLFLAVGFGTAARYAEASSARALARALEPRPPGTIVACLECFVVGLPFYVGQPVIYITRRGRGGLTSNYVRYRLKRDDNWPAILVRLDDRVPWLAQQTAPVYVLTKSPHAHAPRGHRPLPRRPRGRSSDRAGGAPSSRRRFGPDMCGVCGIAAPGGGLDGAWASSSRPRDDRRARAPRTRRLGPARGRRGRARGDAARDPRPRRRPAADGRRGQRHRGGLQRGDRQPREPPLVARGARAPRRRRDRRRGDPRPLPRARRRLRGAARRGLRDRRLGSSREEPPDPRSRPGRRAPALLLPRRTAWCASRPRSLRWPSTPRSSSRRTGARWAATSARATSRRPRRRSPRCARSRRARWSSSSAAARRHRRYWRWSITTARTARPTVEGFDEVFREAVRRQSDAEVECGVFLSGGLDSSLVAAVAKDLAPQIGGSAPTRSDSRRRPTTRGASPRRWRASSGSTGRRSP